MTRTLSCSCGEMHWAIAPQAIGTHIVCYCGDCQTFANHQGRADTLENGGTHLFQTLPADFQITKGAEHLSLLRLSPKGLMRWYAGCCGAPIANTLPKSGFPFVGAVIPADTQEFGKVQAHVFTETAKTRIKQRGMATVTIGIFARALRAWLAGQRQSPFFDSAGQPVSPQKVLTLEERNAARP